MSYADIAKKGPKQSDEEKYVPVPHTIPEIAHPDADGGRTVNALAPEPNNVPSYADQQLQAERAEQTKQDTKRALSNAADDAKDFGNKASKDAQRLASDAEKKAGQVTDEAGKKADQAGKKGKEVADEAGKKAEQAGKKVKEVANEAGQKAQELGEEAEEEFEDLKEEGSKKYQQAKKEASRAADKTAKNYDEFKQSAAEDTEHIKASAEKNFRDAKVEVKHDAEALKQDGKKAEEWTEKNKGNPVFLGNVVVIGALAAVLGTNGYRMYQARTLTWPIVGAWAGAVGLFGVADFYVSSWLFKNKYPSK